MHRPIGLDEAQRKSVEPVHILGSEDAGKLQEQHTLRSIKS
jgi:hypothetical protein